MSNAAKFTKSVTAMPGGTDGTYRLGVHEQFFRLTNLPANWLKIRFGAFMSFTDLAGDNNVPTLEQISHGNNPRLQFMMGMSNGVGYPPDAGNKFLGWGQRGNGDPQINISLYSGAYYLANGAGGFYLHPNHVRWNGTAFTQTIDSTNIQALYAATPNAASTYCFAMVLELDVTTAGTSVMKFSYVNNASRASDVDMLVQLCTPVGGPVLSLTGGWHDNSGSHPIGLQYFSVRSPFSLSRLRIHNVGYLQLA